MAEFSTIEVHTENGNIVVVGFLDRRLIEPHHVQRVDDELRRAVAEAEHNHFVLDFHRVEYLSSAMLGAIINAHAAAAERGGALCMCELSKDLQKLFKMMKLDNRIKMHKNLDKAKASF